MEGNASSSSTVVQQTQDKHQFEKRRNYSSWCPDPRAQLLRGSTRIQSIQPPSWFFINCMYLRSIAKEHAWRLGQI
ncbi:hypothetical protein PAHAL_1G408200 [Panicum hallii]|uniref:Uncharacterized protein n=1 Tax=Panicum hallii TaxID=206008 RepID=A0A2T8KXV9_9POAL|nr:hypothetical protein PAHAL_1G408200 [Panicum hallii]